MAPVHPYKTFWWQQIFEPLQYFTNYERRSIGKKHPAIIAAAFNADNLCGLQANVAATLTKWNFLHGLNFLKWALV